MDKKGVLSALKIGIFLMSFILLSTFVSAQSVSNVTLNATSANNFTTDNLTATVSGLSPVNASVQFDWYKDSVLSAVFLGNATFQNTIPYWFTAVGEVWYVNATPKNLTNNYNVSNASFVDNLSVSAQEASPSGMAFNNDGTKLYVIGSSSDKIHEYNLSTAFDVSTGVSVDNFSVFAQDQSPKGMAFNNDGTKVYMVGSAGDDIHEYNLSTAFDVSTGTFVDTLNVSAQETNPQGMAFNNDGTKLYVVGTVGDDINEYDLSIAFDVSTGTFVDIFNISAQETFPLGMAFNNDGTKLYVGGLGGISEYNLSTAFDVSTGVFVDNLSVSSPQGMAFNNDGTKLYVVIGSTSDDINEYDVGSVDAGTTVQSNNITIDPTNPTATASCSPSSVKTGDSFPCTCSGSGSGSDINTTSASSTSGSITDTSSTGTFTYTCTVTDLEGNSATATATYSVIGSGGGGVIINKSYIEKINSWSKIDSGEIVLMSDFDKDFGINQIQIEVSEETLNAKIIVRKYHSKPIEVSKDISGEVYRYLEISTENLENKLEKGIVRFQVEKSWVLDQGLNKEDISVFKFDESSEEWKELGTVYVEEDNTYYYYNVELDSFGYFAISAKTLAEKTVGGIGEKITEAKKSSFLWIVLIVLVALAVWFYFFRRKKKKKR